MCYDNVEHLEGKKYNALGAGRGDLVSGGEVHKWSFWPMEKISKVQEREQQSEGYVQSVEWSTPLPRSVKCDVDAAFFENVMEMDIGICIRDE